MEREPYENFPFSDAKIYSRDRDVLQTGQSQARSLHEAGAEVASTVVELRSLAVNSRDESGDVIPLDSELLPGGDFNPPTGTPKLDSNGSQRLSAAEERAGFWYEDVQGI